MFGSAEAPARHLCRRRPRPRHNPGRGRQADRTKMRERWRRRHVAVGATPAEFRNFRHITRLRSSSASQRSRVADLNGRVVRARVGAGAGESGRAGEEFTYHFHFLVSRSQTSLRSRDLTTTEFDEYRMSNQQRRYLSIPAAGVGRCEKARAAAFRALEGRTVAQLRDYPFPR
jgi:hypothetical protein